MPSGLPGGAFYDPYAAAQAKYGSYTVTDIFVVVDGPSQTVDFDNSQVTWAVHVRERRVLQKGWMGRLHLEPRPVQEPGRLRELLQQRQVEPAQLKHWGMGGEDQPCPPLPSAAVSIDATG